MQVSYLKIGAAAFAGKIVATIFLLVCATFGFGPDRWLAWVMGGLPPMITPALARAVFLFLGLATFFFLVWQWRFHKIVTRNIHHKELQAQTAPQASLSMVVHRGIGNDNTLVNVPVPPNLGDGNTIIGATDADGNAIYNKGGTAIGKGARASLTGIAIGAGAHGGHVNIQGNVSAGDGTAQVPGADANIEGGAGYRGASGGDVNLGPGNFRAGNAGAGGAGGKLNIKGGDAK